MRRKAGRLRYSSPSVSGVPAAPPGARPIPVELEQAAMVDGSTRLGALFRVTLPLAMPGVVTALIFTFISALALTSSNADYPLTVRLDSFIN
jgi:ABC-type glycerol-3-phosphate transport system permease component